MFSVARTHEHLCITSKTPMNVLSSGVIGGGYTRARHMVNLMVHRGYMSDYPETDTRERLQKIGYSPDESVALLTAVWMDDAVVHHVTATDGVKIVVCASAGFANAAHVLDVLPTGLPTIGTVNVLVAVDGMLSPSAHVASIITVTEAKAAALTELEIRSRNQQHFATGTTSDAVAIGCLPSLSLNEQLAAPIEYAGLATPYGRALAQATFQAIYESGTKYFTRISQLQREGALR